MSADPSFQLQGRWRSPAENSQKVALKPQLQDNQNAGGLGTENPMWPIGQFIGYSLGNPTVRLIAFFKVSLCPDAHTTHTHKHTHTLSLSLVHTHPPLPAIHHFKSTCRTGYTFLCFIKKTF